MRQPTDQQRVIKGELRQARDLLVAEFLCEIGSDNGDIETGTPRLVRLNILLSTLPPSCVYTFPEMREYFQRKLDSDRTLSLLIELGAIRLITSSLDPDSSSVVTVGSLWQRQRWCLIKFGASRRWEVFLWQFVDSLELSLYNVHGIVHGIVWLSILSFFSYTLPL